MDSIDITATKTENNILGPLAHFSTTQQILFDLIRAEKTNLWCFEIYIKYIYSKTNIFSFH